MYLIQVYYVFRSNLWSYSISKIKITNTAQKYTLDFLLGGLYSLCTPGSAGNSSCKIWKPGVCSWDGLLTIPVEEEKKIRKKE